MRTTRASGRCFGAVLLLLAGCWTTEPEVKPPPHPEEYFLPPETDSRFTSPIEYPRGLLNQDMIKKPSVGPGGAQPGSAGFGAGPGMRGGY